MRIKKKYAVPILVSAGMLAIAAAYFFSAPKNPGTGRVHEIRLTESGFTPADLTVAAGDTVVFRTELGRHFWPASDLHPTHGIYPEFDPKEPVAPAHTWSFGFKKVGAWKYHDHLSPYFTGTITVVGDSRSSKNCENKDRPDVECWQERLIKTLSEKGVEATLDQVAELYASETRFPESCHYLAHNIGIASYKLYLKDKDSVLTPKASFCANGFYHGFMEGFLTATRDPKLARDFCARVREKIDPLAPDASLQCHHGIGHGVMDMLIADRQNVGDERKIVAPALALCEKASDTEAQRYRCASGVFNGIANFYITGEHGLSVRKDNPIWLCEEQAERDKESCYGNMNTIIFEASEKDFGRSIRIVESMKDGAYAKKTMQYLGGLAAIPLYLEGKIADSVKACRTAREDLGRPCIEGLSHGFLEHGTPDMEYRDALAFCESPFMKTEEREWCSRYVLSNLRGWYSREKTAAICENVPAQYREYCKESNASS